MFLVRLSGKGKLAIIISRGPLLIKCSLHLICSWPILVYKKTFFIMSGKDKKAGSAKDETPKPKAPLYKFAFVSMSNVTSTFCMYEALKYVSFTTTVVGRSMKIIPVMLMGVVLNGQSYPMKEYMIGVAITFGVLVFKFGDINTQMAPTQKNKHPGYKAGAHEYSAGN